MAGLILSMAFAMETTNSNNPTWNPSVVIEQALLIVEHAPP